MGRKKKNPESWVQGSYSVFHSLSFFLTEMSHSIFDLNLNQLRCILVLILVRKTCGVKAANKCVYIYNILGYS